MKDAKHKLILWHIIALLGVLIAVPNGTVTKVVTDALDPLWLNVYRFALIALVTLPVLIYVRKKFTTTNLKLALLAGVGYAGSVACYTGAVALSQASYVAILTLPIPIVLMLLSVWLTREKITARSYVGIGVAAMGAATIILLPVIFGASDGGGANLAATLLGLGTCLMFPLTIILTRKASDHGLNLWATLGVASWMVIVINAGLALGLGREIPPLEVALSWNILPYVAFSALGVSLLARVMTVWSYRRLGSATVAGLTYIENFLAILLPIAILGELLTLEMVAGGLLILVGVYIMETKHHKHLHHHYRKHRHWHHTGA